MLTLLKEGAKKFGSQCIVVAVDAKKVDNNKWEVFTHGGRNPLVKMLWTMLRK